MAKHIYIHRPVAALLKKPVKEREARRMELAVKDAWTVTPTAARKALVEAEKITVNSTWPEINRIRNILAGSYNWGKSEGFPEDLLTGLRNAIQAKKEVWEQKRKAEHAGGKPAKDAASWMEVRSEILAKLEVGKSYNFDGKVGKVLEKSGKLPVGQGRGLPMVRVQWKETKDASSDFPSSVMFEGKRYFKTGKMGTNMRSGGESAEYAYQENGRDDRVWLDLKTKKVARDAGFTTYDPREVSRLKSEIAEVDAKIKAAKLPFEKKDLEQVKAKLQKELTKYRDASPETIQKRKFSNEQDWRSAVYRRYTRVSFYFNNSTGMNEAYPKDKGLATTLHYDPETQIGEIHGGVNSKDSSPVETYYQWAKSKGLDPQGRVAFRQYVREKNLNPNVAKDLEIAAGIGKAVGWPR